MYSTLKEILSSGSRNEIQKKKINHQLTRHFVHHLRWLSSVEADNWFPVMRSSIPLCYATMVLEVFKASGAQIQE